jgi:hypothetical protein
MQCASQAHRSKRESVKVFVLEDRQRIEVDSEALEREVYWQLHGIGKGAVALATRHFPSEFGTQVHTISTCPVRHNIFYKFPSINARPWDCCF